MNRLVKIRLDLSVSVQMSHTYINEPCIYKGVGCSQEIWITVRTGLQKSGRLRTASSTWSRDLLRMAWHQSGGQEEGGEVHQGGLLWGGQEDQGSGGVLQHQSQYHGEEEELERDCIIELQYLRLFDRSGYCTQGDSLRATGWVLGHVTGLFLSFHGGSRGPELWIEKIQRHLVRTGIRQKVSSSWFGWAMW